jgi:hypothetical protein
VEEVELEEAEADVLAQMPHQLRDMRAARRVGRIQPVEPLARVRETRIDGAEREGVAGEGEEEVVGA